MEKTSLVALLDEDREPVLAAIARDRALPAVQAALEKEIDRVLYRYCEGCDDALQRESAQHILQAMKHTLPVIDAVGEARTWKKHVEPYQKNGPRFTLLSGALLAAGLVLVMASVLGVLIAGHGGTLAFVKALLPVVLGCGCLFFSGLRSMAPEKARASKDEATERTEFLADGEKAWHCLRGAMLQADGQLDRIRGEMSARRDEAAAASTGPMDAKTLELFAELLEAAYASAGDGAREAASAIRFHLHGANVDVVDYAEGREAWFEFLPAAKPGTIRPALTSNGKLLKKGMASAAR